VDERLFKLLDADEVATVADAERHVLLELPHELFVDPLPLIRGLGDRGIQAVITHPERYAYLHGSTARIQSWVAAGAALQITAGSLVGDFGRHAMHSAWRLVGDGWASLVATDAHDAVRRPPRLTRAIELIEAEMGTAAAKLICGENPLKLLQGQHVSPQTLG
jgi:protein-tyrosine phosphatase